MITCPNKNLKDWKDLVKTQGEKNAYFLWNEYRGVVPSNYLIEKSKNEINTETIQLKKNELSERLTETENVDSELLRNDVYQELFGTSFKEFYNVIKNDSTLNDTSFLKQARILSNKFGVPLTFDESLEASGKIVYDKNGKPSITVNPNYLTEDTLSHEYGHLLIDIIGLKNARIQAALQQLKDSSVEKEVKAAYPELSGDMLQREILATALGRKAVEVLPENQSWWSRFADWFFNFIGVKLKNSEITELAKELWNPAKSYSNVKINLELTQLKKLMTHEKEIDTKDLRATLNKYRDTLTIKINRWKHNKDGKAYVESLKKLIPDIDAFLKEEEYDGILNLVNKAYDDYDNLKKKLQDESLTSENLVIMKSFINSFEPLRALNSFMIMNKSEMLTDGDVVRLSEEDFNAIKIKLEGLIANESAIKDKLLTLSKTIIATKFSQKSSRVERIFEITEERRLKAENPDLSNTEVEDRIIAHLEKNKDLIEKQSFQYFYNILEESVDIETLWRVLDSGQVNSSLIQLVQKDLDRADLNTASKFIAGRNEIKKLKDRYNAINSSLNQEEKFKNILHQGEESDYLVGEYDPAFLDTYLKLKRAYNESFDKIDDPVELAKDRSVIEYTNWTTENIETTSAIKDGEKITQQKPIAKWKSKVKLSLKEQEIVNDMKDLIKHYDKNLSVPKDRLMNNDFGTEFFLLPQMEKSSAERIRENGILDTIEGSFGDALKKRNDDLELNPTENAKSTNLFSKKVFATEDNKLDHRIPVYYRRKIEKKDRSRDIFSLLLANAWTTVNHNEKSLISADLELLSDVLEEKKYLKTSNNKIFKNALNKIKNVQDDTKRESTMLSSIMENRLYGLGEIEKMLTDEVSINKINSVVNSWSSSVMLGLNYFAAVPNFAMGKTMNFVESMGGLIYNRRNLVNAEKAYWKDLPNVMKDMNSSRPLSKTQILMDYFEVLNDVNSSTTKFVDDGSFRANMKKDSIFFLSHGVEHNVQGTMMYAVLDSIEHNGKKLIDLVQVKDGELVFTETLPEVLLSRAKSRIKKVIADSHGQYDQRMKSDLQREWYGKSMLMFRKWISRGTTRRFKGFHNVFKEYADFENSNDFSNFFSEESEMFEEGSYVSFLRLLMKDFKKYKLNYLKKYKTLTRYEQANVRKTLTEITMFTTMLLFATLLQGLAKDEDDETAKRSLYMMAYWSRRTYSELRFFSSPSEMLNIIKSPAASLSMVTKVTTALFELTPGLGFNEYQRAYGEYEKGDLKLWRRLKDITPLYAQIFRYKNPQDALSYITK